MNVSQLLEELFERIGDEIHVAVDGLSPAELTTAPAPAVNTIGWLVWHLTRVQDDHIAELLEREQVWTTGPWPERFGLTADASNTGYDHSADDVATVRPESAAALVEYYEAVAAVTAGLLSGLGDADLDRVVDERWTPPVTLGARLISVADDDIQHAGQAAYVRGLLGR